MKTLYTLALLFWIVPAVAGIYRHDIPAEKYRELARQQAFDCVGEVFEGNSEEVHGSCVLIGPKYVLSAAHCFLISDNVVDTQYVIKGQKITTYKQVNTRAGTAHEYAFRFNGKRYTGKRLVIFPGYLADIQKGFGDLVLIELEDTVTGIIPANINRNFDEMNIIATGVGYGVSGRGNKPEEVEPRKEKIAGQNIIDSIGGEARNGQWTKLMADFDHPSKSKWNKMGNAKPCELEYAVGGGDSGGPLFRQATGGWELIGICSGGGVSMDELLSRGYYSQVSEWTRVSVFYDWIEETLMELTK